MSFLNNVFRAFSSVGFKLLSHGRPRFECPVCGYMGSFRDVGPTTGIRKHAQCPGCGALERHRLQYLVIMKLLGSMDPSEMSMIHFAPEPFLSKLFRAKFKKYVTADLDMEGVDYRVDIRFLPFADSSYDFIFASHVLEHVQDDAQALNEIRRVLKPGGIAVLPVPLVCLQTIEYPEPNPNESWHVRAPGPDYYDRYEQFFSSVERFSSESFPARFQLFEYEDRSSWPTEECPLRTPSRGKRHPDIVPVCYV